MKKQSKCKRCFNKIKAKYRKNRRTIFIAIFLIIFPIILGLIYKIPIHFIDVEIGELLSFYGVALGLFVTYITYIEDKRQKDKEKQSALRPQIELILELDNDEFCMNMQLQNRTNNDYSIRYIGHDYYEKDVKYALNANDSITVVLECWDVVVPNSIYILVHDDEKGEWFLTYEKQEGFNKYCRIFVDPIG